MRCQSPQLPSMAENNLVKSSLQGTFKDIVSCGADVNISIVPARPLRVNRANASCILWKLKAGIKTFDLQNTNPEP